MSDEDAVARVTALADMYALAALDPDLAPYVRAQAQAVADRIREALNPKA